MNKDPWNKCTECGKFVAYYDFVEKIAVVNYLEPSNEFGDERIEILCGDCKAHGTTD